MEELTIRNFNKKVLGSKKPVLVFFTGKFCYPGKRMEPILEGLSEDFGGSIKFLKFTVDENTFDFAKELKLKAVPTLAVYKEGANVNSLVGFEPEPVIASFIEESLRI